MSNRDPDSYSPKSKAKIKLDEVMKNKLFSIAMQLVNAKAGGVVQWAVGAVFGVAVAKLAELGINIPQESVVEFQLACVGFFTLLVQSVVQWYQNAQAVKLQAALEMPKAKQDGWVGPETVRRAIVVNAE